MSTEAMKLALEALEDISALQNHSDSVDSSDVDKAITTLQEELAQQQEPVAWRVKWPAIGGGYKWLMVDKPLMEKEGFVNEALYTSPPAQRKPLTDEEIKRRKPISADFVSFRAGVRCMEREYGSGAKR